jgi:hypothetical protein
MDGPAAAAGDRVVSTSARRAVCLAAVLAIGTSCAGARNSLNTTASPCFRALAAADDAVHRKGRLVGVRLVETEDLAQKVPEAAALGHQKLCGVAYRDDFTSGEVSGATPGHTGHYALVLVDRSQRVIASFLLDELPIRFTHRV